jgi:hypothetical protein
MNSFWDGVFGAIEYAYYYVMSFSLNALLSLVEWFVGFVDIEARFSDVTQNSALADLIWALDFFYIVPCLVAYSYAKLQSFVLSLILNKFA